MGKLKLCQLKSGKWAMRSEEFIKNNPDKLSPIKRSSKYLNSIVRTIQRGKRKEPRVDQGVRIAKITRIGKTSTNEGQRAIYIPRCFKFNYNLVIISLKDDIITIKPIKNNTLLEKGKELDNTNLNGG